MAIESRSIGNTDGENKLYNTKTFTWRINYDDEKSLIISENVL